MKQHNLGKTSCLFAAMALALAACGDDDADGPDARQPPSDGALPPGDGALPPVDGSLPPGDAPPPADDVLKKLRLPPGFRISLVTAAVPNARAMTLGDQGTLFVGSRALGTVYAVIDDNDDHVAERVQLVANGLRMPAGVAFRDGNLYVSAIDRILRYEDIESQLASPPEPAVVSSEFPTAEHHGWKYIAFGPDGLLYVPVGSPCNICKEEDERFASIMRMQPDGTNLEVFAHGVRNTVGFDWHPQTGELWFTDNGRDWLGDDAPPDELNRAPTAGMHFGFPFCHGTNIADPIFGAERACSELTPPEQELGAHVAALGMRFYTGTQFPAEYQGAIFIAEHGSWNRGTPVGYRITVVKLGANGEPASYETFIDGWLDEVSGTAWGRPADVLVHPDGSLLISDDEMGYIYRVTYEP